MKRTINRMLGTLLVLVLIFGCFGVTAAQDDEYIPVHTEEELKSLFTQVKGFLDEKGQKLVRRLDEDQNRIVTNALIRSWGITQYENATPKQIDDAYDALFNMSLFLGLAADPQETFSTGKIFQYAVQLLDQEYFDLLKESGEDPENIDYAAYLRDISEALVEDPESFTEEEVQDFLKEIYAESYLAAGLKAIAHTEALPLPEELFAEEQSQAMMPNPVVKYETADPLSQMLGIKMPELPEEYGAKLGYHSIIAEVLAESEYEFPNGALLVFRLSPEADLDISGVYGAEFYADWTVAGTAVEVDTYLAMFIARGNVKTMDGTVFSFAVDAEDLEEETFRKAVSFFVESCMNQRVSK